MIDMHDTHTVFPFPAPRVRRRLSLVLAVGAVSVLSGCGSSDVSTAGPSDTTAFAAAAPQTEPPVATSAGTTAVATAPAGPQIEFVRSVDGPSLGFTAGDFAADADGNLYLFALDNDAATRRITKVGPDGTKLAEWGEAGSGPAQFAYKPTSTTGNVDDFPGGFIDVAPDGRVYVADSQNHRVQVFDADGVFLEEFGGASGRGDVPTDSFLGGMFVDSSGVFYTEDWNAVSVLGFAGDGTRRTEVKIGTEPSVAFVGLAADGRIFVSDFTTGTIHVYAPDGTETLQIGTAGDQPGQFQGIAQSVAGDDQGFVYAADGSPNGVQIFDPSGQYVGAITRAGDVALPGVAGVRVVGDSLVLADIGGNLYVYSLT